MPPAQWVVRNRWHLFIIVALLTLQFLVPDILALRYERQVRPGLLASGYSTCVGFTSAAPDFMPEDCDVVRRSQTLEGIEEHYFSRGGAKESLLIVPARGARSMQTEFRTNQATMWLPLLALGVFFLSLVHKVVRTGAFSSWALAAERNDPLESLLRLYALPLFIGSILFGLLGR